MTDKNKKLIKSALMSLCLTLFLYWYLFETMTGERITIVEASNDNIVVQEGDHHLITIKINIDISKLIKVDQKYDVQYKKRFFQSPRLISISPVN